MSQYLTGGREEGSRRAGGGIGRMEEGGRQTAEGPFLGERLRQMFCK